MPRRSTKNEQFLAENYFRPWHQIIANFLQNDLICRGAIHSNVRHHLFVRLKLIGTHFKWRCYKGEEEAVIKQQDVNYLSKGEHKKLISSKVLKTSAAQSFWCWRGPFSSLTSSLLAYFIWSFSSARGERAPRPFFKKCSVRHVLNMPHWETASVFEVTVVQESHCNSWIMGQWQPLSPLWGDEGKKHVKHNINFILQPLLRNVASYQCHSTITHPS